MIPQYEYLKSVADECYAKFFAQGFADAGNNGPHGHIDTPVRNTGHFLIIYSFLYKRTGDKKYRLIADRLAEYLYREQAKSKNGAIQCMVSDQFDHLNGLIGQGWVIESLLYYYDVSRDRRALESALKIFYSQRYDYSIHLWHRVELDGSDIGIDPTYNHNIWFAACSVKLLDFADDPEVDRIIRDLLTEGAKRDFATYRNGLLRHSVKIADKKALERRIKRAIKIILYPLRWVNLKKLDYRYMEKGYQIFDMYGFCVLEERYSDLPLFSDAKYLKAKEYALDIDTLNKEYGISDSGETSHFNVYSYSYNSPAFEYPYVAAHFGRRNTEIIESLFDIQKQLMFDSEANDFTKNNPDIATFHSRTYEIIRYLELVDDSALGGSID